MANKKKLPGEKKIGVLMVRKDMVRGQTGGVYSGHVGPGKGRTGYFK